MPSIIPWRTSVLSCAGTPQAPKLNRVPLPNKDPEDDMILSMATKNPATPAMHVRQIKTSNPSKPPPVLKSCLKKRDPSPSSSSTTSSSASSASSSSYPRSPPPQFRSREDVAIYSESEASPTRHRGHHGRHLRSSDGVESDYEKTGSQMRHSRSNLKNSSESSRDLAFISPRPKPFSLPIFWRLTRHLTLISGARSCHFRSSPLLCRNTSNYVALVADAIQSTHVAPMHRIRYLFTTKRQHPRFLFPKVLGRSRLPEVGQ